MNVQLYTCGLPALPVICNIWDSAYSSKTPLTYCIVDLVITRWAGRFTWRKGDKLFISVNAYTIAMKPTIIRITNVLDKYLVKWQYTTFFDQSFEFEYFTSVGFKSKETLAKAKLDKRFYVSSWRKWPEKNIYLFWAWIVSIYPVEISDIKMRFAALIYAFKLFLFDNYWSMFSLFTTFRAALTLLFSNLLDANFFVTLQAALSFTRLTAKILQFYVWH